jgi:hypothetical protein
LQLSEILGISPQLDAPGRAATEMPSDAMSELSPLEEGLYRHRHDVFKM